MRRTSYSKGLNASGKGWEVRALCRQWMRQAGPHMTVSEFIERRQNTRSASTRQLRQQLGKKTDRPATISPSS